MLIGGRPKEADIRFTPYTRTQDLLRVHTLPAPPPHHLDKKKEKKKCVAGFDKRASHTQLVLVKNPSGDGWGWPTLRGLQHSMTHTVQSIPLRFRRQGPRGPKCTTNVDLHERLSTWLSRRVLLYSSVLWDLLQMT